ncbi:hypothetical protein, partial [Pseudogemmobacter humi]|uniref:hypothetical protein n=1 Tax=Pseudogemmobacter humi TaxID=2483812 RepID=UPI0011CE658C
MTIRPIIGKGVNRATAVCDGCAREETITCDYERSASGAWLPNEGQITRKLCAHGWAVVRGKLHCPACEAQRKAAASAKPDQKEKVPMAVKEAPAAPLREPDKAMRIDIFVAISSCYDLAAQRYRSDATDRSVAEVVGGGLHAG